MQFPIEKSKNNSILTLPTKRSMLLAKKCVLPKANYHDKEEETDFEVIKKSKPNMDHCELEFQTTSKIGSGSKHNSILTLPTKNPMLLAKIHNIGKANSEVSVEQNTDQNNKPSSKMFAAVAKKII